MGFQASVLIVTWAAMLVLALAIVGLLRQVHALAGADPPGPHTLGPEIGASAPPLHPDDAIASEAPLVALFLDDSCDSCARTLRVAEELAGQGTGHVQFIALFAAGMNGHGSSDMNFIEDAAETFERYQVTVTPYCVVIGRDRRIAESTPIGSEAEFRALATRVLRER